jgi:hypothetical protein
VLVSALRDEVKMIRLREAQRQQEKLAAREELDLAAEEIADLGVPESLADAVQGGSGTAKTCPHPGGAD